MTASGYCCGDENNHPDFSVALRYEKSTGKFFWIKRINSRGNPGKEAGNIVTDGGRFITYKKRRWQASRLAWYFVYGCFPVFCIDHINGNRDDNRIENLREVTVRENMQNMKTHREGKLVGAHKRKNNKWESHIKINGKIIYLGTFDSDKEASDKYWEAASSLKAKPDAGKGE
jgi:hypothetical protein